MPMRERGSQHEVMADQNLSSRKTSPFAASGRIARTLLRWGLTQVVAWLLSILPRLRLNTSITKQSSTQCAHCRPLTLPPIPAVLAQFSSTMCLEARRHHPSMALALRRCLPSIRTSRLCTLISLRSTRVSLAHSLMRLTTIGAHTTARQSILSEGERILAAKVHRLRAPRASMETGEDRILKWEMRRLEEDLAVDSLR